VTLGGDRKALGFGSQRNINLHQQGKEFERKGQGNDRKPGVQADLVLINRGRTSREVVIHLEAAGVRGDRRRLKRTGGRFRTTTACSVSFGHRDLPELIEVSKYIRE